MSFRILCTFACAGVFSILAACSSDSSGSGDDDGDDDTGASSSSGGSSGGGSSGGGSSGGSSSGGATELTCESLALCTTNEVKIFLGDVPAAAGGTLGDGLYRLEYLIAGTDDPQAVGHSSVEALGIDGGQFIRASGFGANERGRVSTSGTTLSFGDRVACSLGATGDPISSSDEYEYTATADTISLYSEVSSNGGRYLELHVFKKIDGPRDVCETVDTEPSAPGSNSAQCHVSNCGCVIKSGSGTIDRDSCPS